MRERCIAVSSLGAILPSEMIVRASNRPAAWGLFAGYERIVVFLQMMSELLLNAGIN
jgi:lipoprotein signal peptidase